MLNQQYRRLGGWLTFIQVMTIILIVVYSLSLLSAIYLCFIVGFFDAAYYGLSDVLGNAPALEGLFGYYGFTVVQSLIFSILNLAAVICVLVFLNKRNLRYFKIAFFAGYAFVAFQYIVQTIYYAANPLRNILGEIMEYDSYYDYEGFLLGNSMSDFFSRVFVATNIVCLIITIGLAVAWFFYFQRSERVRVYFDPNFVPPAYIPPPAMPAPQPAYAYPAPMPYPPATQPAPRPAAYPQYGGPSPAAYSPAGYPSPAGGAYPPPYDRPAAPQQPMQPAPPAPYGAARPIPNQPANRPAPSALRSSEAAYVQNTAPAPAPPEPPADS